MRLIAIIRLSALNWIKYTYFNNNKSNNKIIMIIEYFLFTI